MVKYEGYQDSNWGEIFYTYVSHREKANWRRVKIAGSTGIWMWEGTCGRGDEECELFCNSCNKRWKENE